jgi:spore germination protein D
LFKTWRLFALIAVGWLAAVGCSNHSSSQGTTTDYQTTKKMVVDMLKSDDGKNAIKEILNDEAFKQQLVIDQELVKRTITQTMTSEEGKKFWDERLKNPEFSRALAKTMMENNEALLKKLINDPDYQKMMMNLFKAPNMEREYLDLLKTQPFRAQIRQNILEAVDSPLFSAKLTEALNKALDEQLKKNRGNNGQPGGMNAGSGGSGGM